MTDFFYWGGPVYCSTAEKIQWQRPTRVYCHPLEGSSNGAFFSTLGSDPVTTLLSKAGASDAQSVGFGGFSAFHGFLDPLLQAQADRVDYVHLADACFSGAGSTTAKKGFLAFARRAASGQARMTVTTNGPWEKDIHYWGGKGTKYEGVEFSLTSGARCFSNVWREAIGSPASAQDSSPAIPDGVPKPDRVFRAGELYWFHYEGTGQKDPHGWHANTLALPYMQLYGVPWMAGDRSSASGEGPFSLPPTVGFNAQAAAVLGMGALAALTVAAYWWGRKNGYLPNPGVVYLPGQFPKVCSCCGRIYTREQWHNLPFLALWGDGEAQIEMRNCPCGTTLSVDTEI